MDTPTWAPSGEIRTPNLDSLANEGVRFHQLLHPRDLLADALDRPEPASTNHLNRLGNMTEWTRPTSARARLRGTLNQRFATLPQLLQGAATTPTCRQVHLGKQPDQIPRARGFERDFSLLRRRGSYWGT